MWDQHQTAASLAAFPTAVANLRRDHHDDGHGLCVGCTTAGYGAPHVPWPCFLRLLADEAHQIAVSRKFATPIAA